MTFPSQAKMPKPLHSTVNGYMLLAELCSRFSTAMLTQ